MKAILCEKFPKETKVCTTPFTEQSKLAITRIEKEVGTPSAQKQQQSPHGSSASSFNKYYPENTSLIVNSEEVTLGCWPLGRVSNKAITVTSQ